MPRLTYIGQTPSEGTGSPVIVLRHLQRLASNGWDITVIGERGDDSSSCDHAGWPVKHLPLRGFWWPPFRPENPRSRAMRTWLLGRECLRLIGHRPDAVFGYLAAHADFSPEVAARFAAQTNVPLSLLIHDDAAAFAHDEAERERLRLRHAAILREAHRCWFVSRELAETYDVTPEARRVLPPLPEGWTQPASWREEHAHRRRIYYAGFIWPPQYRLLTRLARQLQESGARLCLLTRETPELRGFLETGLADWYRPFPSNREALSHLVADAAGLIVSYTDTTAEMPWVATSFPSKFVEYAHLGLPCAVVAPQDSSIGLWCSRNAYGAYYAPDDHAGFASWASALAQENSWARLAQGTAALADGPFNPSTIHAQLEADLRR